MAGEIIEQFTQHEDLIVSRFVEQLKNATFLKALAKSYAKQLQDIEDAAFEVLLERSLETAEGVQLTILGKIVGAERTTSDDTQFKIAIQAQQVINRSSGTPEDLIKLLVLTFSLAADETFTFREEPPAQIRITVQDILSLDPLFLQQILDSADVAGNRMLLSYSPSLPATRLRFTDSGGNPLSGTGSSDGFGDSLGNHTGALLVSVTEG